MYFVIVGMRGSEVIKDVVEADDVEYAKRLFVALKGTDTFIHVGEATVGSLVRMIREIESDANRRVFEAVSETITRFTPRSEPTRKPKSR